MSSDISFRHIIVTYRRPVTLCHRHIKGTNPLPDYGLNRFRLHLYLQRVFPQPMLLQGGTVPLGKIAEQLLKRALVEGRIKRSEKEEHLLSWPFFGQIPEATRIGDRQTTDLFHYIQQVFVARDEHIGLGSQCGCENPLIVFNVDWN
jgi:hypothetical protein